MFSFSALAKRPEIRGQSKWKDDLDGQDDDELG